MFNTPVALFVFNRPEITGKIFKIIAQVKPLQLFIIADGPRSSHPDDIHLCDAVRKIVTEIGWDCNVSRLYATENIGCRHSIPEGLNWVFSQVEECIILEDDCIPDPTFFNYCTALLEYYRDAEKIMTIGGYRCDGPNEFNTDSYFFSKYPSTWGWATWKRSWEKFDLDMKEWATLRNTDWLSDILSKNEYIHYWQRIFDKMCNNLDAWDYALAFACWLNGGLSIRSKINLISNIGFGPDATHTFYINDEISFRRSQPMPFPLVHPKEIIVYPLDEDRIEWVIYSGMTKRILTHGRERIVNRRNLNK